MRVHCPKPGLPGQGAFIHLLHQSHDPTSKEEPRKNFYMCQKTCTERGSRQA